MQILLILSTLVSLSWAVPCEYEHFSAANPEACNCGSTVCIAGTLCDIGNNRCSADPCINTNGLVATDVDCTCGSSRCSLHAYVDQFCYAAASKCLRNPIIDCEGTDGVTYDSADCKCGSTACVGENFCYAADSKCSRDPIEDCETTDGSYSDNSQKCICGSKVCEKIFGVQDTFCYAATSHCSPDPIPDCNVQDGSTEWKFVEGFHKDRTEVPNKDECACGSAVCNDGHFCHAASSKCASVALAECEVKDGSVANGECICGSAACPSGRFCYASNSKCSDVAILDCTEQNGLEENDAACTCGSATCVAGNFCTSNGQCSDVAIPDCTKQDGSVANDEACTCGNVICTGENGINFPPRTGLFCFHANGSGSCHPKAVRSGYAEVTSETCNEPIQSLAECTEAAIALGFKFGGDFANHNPNPVLDGLLNKTSTKDRYGVADLSKVDTDKIYIQSLIASGCSAWQLQEQIGYVWNPAPRTINESDYNLIGITASPLPCTFDAEGMLDGDVPAGTGPVHCLCKAVQMCQSDGSEKNVRACKCGSVMCDSGDFCYDSVCSHVAVSDCLVKEGKNVDACTCGTAPHAATCSREEYCYASSNQCSTNIISDCRVGDASSVDCMCRTPITDDSKVCGGCDAQALANAYQAANSCG